jgi:hypothetical protein
LSDVVLLVGTPSAPKWDAESLDISIQCQIDWMQRLLLNQEEQPIKERINGTDEDEAETSENSRVDNWIFTQFRDAFVSLERLHLRFEDATTSSSLGLQVQAILFQPATIRNQTTFVSSLM